MELWTRYTATAVAVNSVSLVVSGGADHLSGTTTDFPSEAINLCRDIQLFVALLAILAIVSQKAYSIQVGAFLADSDACQYHAGLSGQ